MPTHPRSADIPDVAAAQNWLPTASAYAKGIRSQTGWSPGSGRDAFYGGRRYFAEHQFEVRPACRTCLVA